MKTRSITRPTSDVASLSKGEVEQSVEGTSLCIFGQERDAPAASFFIFLSYNQHHFTTRETRVYTKTMIFLVPLRMRLFQVWCRQCKGLNDISYMCLLSSMHLCVEVFVIVASTDESGVLTLFSS